MPDIDVDFCYERLQEVLSNVKQKYGAVNMAQIVTFDIISVIGVIKNVGKTLATNPTSMSTILKLIPNETKSTIKDAFSTLPAICKAATKTTFMS